MPRARIRHELKCWPEFFEPTLRGVKQFELRRDDREGGFQVGDELRLNEWDPTIEEPYGPGEGGKHRGYTSRHCVVRVGYVMSASVVDGLMIPLGQERTSPSFVIMSIRLI